MVKLEKRIYVAVKALRGIPHINLTERYLKQQKTQWRLDLMQEGYDTKNVKIEAKEETGTMETAVFLMTIQCSKFKPSEKIDITGETLAKVTKAIKRKEAGMLWKGTVFGVNDNNTLFLLKIGECEEYDKDKKHNVFSDIFGGISELDFDIKFLKTKNGHKLTAGAYVADMWVGQIAINHPLDPVEYDLDFDFRNIYRITR